MKLIADSGSTKTDWRVIGDNGSVLPFSGEGMNPAWNTREQLAERIAKALPEGLAPDAVLFYGAGVSGARKSLMESVLASFFPNAEIVADSDMAGAAASVLGSEKGMAAVLGTGMNSCLWDGSRITMNIPPLGFMLGDEGSGASIGKALLRAWMRRSAPEDILGELDRAIAMSRDEVMDRIYRKPDANRFCGSLARIVTGRQDTDPWYRALLEACFRPFFADIITKYPGYKDFPLGIAGSVGYCCRDILSGIAAEYGVTMGRFVKNPIDGLVAFSTGSVG